MTALFRVTVDVPGWGETVFLYEAASGEAAAARAARLWGGDRVRSVEALGRLQALRARPGAAVRADVLQAVRDFVEAVGRWREPLARALDTLGRGRREVVARLLAAAETGASLGEALRLAGWPEAEARLVEAGERTGALTRILDVVLRNLATEERLIGALRTAAFYPAAVVLAVGVVGGIFKFAVVPGLTKIFAELEASVPKLLSWGPAVLMGLPAAVALAVLAAWASPDVRAAAERLPGLRELLWLRDNIVVFQHLRAAHAAGFGTDRAFDEAAGFCRTDRARTACARLAAWLRGEKTSPDLLRDFQAAALAAGWEGDMAFVYGAGLESGRAEEALDQLIVRYERRLDEHVRRLERALEVGLLLVVGVIVGATVAQFYSTIYGLISKFG